MNTFNPYQAPESELAETPLAPEAGWELASRGSRLGAAMLDGVFFGIAGAIPAFACLGLGFAFGLKDSSDGMAALVIVGAVVGVLGLFGYNLYLLHRTGQSLAKRLLMIKIVRTDGSRASLGRIFWLRMVVASLPRFVPCVGYIYQITDACFIFREDQRCVHDLIADTIVVKAD